MSSSKIKKELQAASLNNKLEQMGQNIAKAIEDLLNPQAKQQSTQSASHEIMFEDSFPLPIFAPPASKGIDTIFSQGSTMPIHREYFGKATAHFDDTLAFLGLDNTLFKGFQVFDLTTGFIERKESTKGFEITLEKELENGESLGYEFPLNFQDFLPEHDVFHQHAPVLAQPNAHVLDIAPVLDPLSDEMDADLENEMAGLFDDLFADINSDDNDIHQEENEVVDPVLDPLLHARANLDDAQEPGVDANPQPPIDDVLNMFGGGHRGGFKVNKPLEKQNILEPVQKFDAEEDDLYEDQDPIDLVLDPTQTPNDTMQQLNLREQLGEPTVHEEEITHGNHSTHSSAESDFSSTEYDFNDLYEEFFARTESTHSSTTHSSDDLFGDLFETTSQHTQPTETTSLFVSDDLFADIQRPPVPELNDLFLSHHNPITKEEMDELFGGTEDDNPQGLNRTTNIEQLLHDTFEEFDSIVATMPKTDSKAKAPMSHSDEALDESTEGLDVDFGILYQMHSGSSSSTDADTDESSHGSDFDDTFVANPNKDDALDTTVLTSTQTKAKVSTSLSDSALEDDANELSRVQLRSVSHSDLSGVQVDLHTFTRPELKHVSTEALHDSTELQIPKGLNFDSLFDSSSSTDVDTDEPVDRHTFVRPELRHVSTEALHDSTELQIPKGLNFDSLFDSSSSADVDTDESSHGSDFSETFMTNPVNVHGLLLALEKMNAEKESASTSSALQSPIEEDMPLLPNVTRSSQDLHTHELSYIKEQLAGEKSSYKDGIHAIHQKLMQFDNVKSEMIAYLKLQVSGLDTKSAEYQNVEKLIALWEKIDTSIVLDHLNAPIKEVNTNGANAIYLDLQQVMAEAVEKTNAYIEQVMLDASSNKVQFSEENNPLISLQTWFEKASAVIESGIKQAEQYKILIGEKLRVVEKLRVEDVIKKIFYGPALSTEDVLSSKPKSSALESAENQFQIKSNTFVEKQAQQSKAEIKVGMAHDTYLAQTQAVADKLEIALPYKKPDTWGDWAKVILAQPATLAHSILSKNEPLDAHKQEIQLLKESMQKAQQEFDYAKQDFNAQISSIAKEFHVQDNSKTVIDWLTMKAEHPDTLAQQQKCIGYLQDLDHKAEIANLWKDVVDQADIALKAIDTYLEQIDALKLANSALVDAYGEYKMAENHLEAVKQQEAELADQLERQFASKNHTSVGSSKAAKDIDTSSHTTTDDAEDFLTGISFDSLFTEPDNSASQLDFGVLFSGGTYTRTDDPLLLSNSSDIF